MPGAPVAQQASKQTGQAVPPRQGVVAAEPEETGPSRPQERGAYATSHALVYASPL